MKSVLLLSMLSLLLLVVDSSFMFIFWMMMSADLELFSVLMTSLIVLRSLVVATSAVTVRCYQCCQSVGCQSESYD